jgi:DNA repair protein RadC
MKIKIPINKISIKHAVDIYEIMQMVLKREEKVDRGKEHFWVLALNNSNRILNLELISLGSSNRTIVEPMQVLSIPLQKQAVGIILVHNHPSGNPEPSEADKDLTNRLIQACRIMHTPVLDHVIITEKSYYSFKESALLSFLEESTKYAMPYDLEKQYFFEMQQAIKEEQKKSKKKIQESLKKGKLEGLKEGEAKGLEKGKQRGLEEGLNKGKQAEKLEIAKNMLLELKLGLDIVQKATGLSKEELEKLSKSLK